MPPANPPPDVFAFSFDPSLQPWNVSPREWLTANDKHFSGIAVASVVFDGQGRVLLVQRAAHDSMPNRWEVPGGAADQEDDEDASGGGAGAAPNPRGTILGSAARELWEEAGLVATRFTHLVAQPAAAPANDATEAPAAASPDHAGYVFTNRTGRRMFLRFSFHAEVKSCDGVVLDPDEHQAYVWASEDEVRAGVMADGRAIPATVPATRAMVLEAFRLRSAGIRVRPTTCEAYRAHSMQ